MMRYNPVKTKMSGLVITTVLLIILSLCLFLFVVISNNEKEIISRSFRVLAQIGENIKTKDKTYLKVTANKWKYTEPNKGSIPVNAVKRTFDGITFEYNIVDTTNVIVAVDLIDTSTIVNVTDLVNPLLRNDVFDEFIIREKDGKKRILFNSLGVDINVNKDNKKDTLLWDAGKMNTVEIGAVEYRSFTLPIEISNEKWWYLDGLIANEKYSEEKRGLGTWFVTLMVLLLVFIVLSFPVARLFLMSWLERINRKTLILISFSLCFGISLITLLLLALTSNYQLKTEREEQLKELANNIENKFIAEIDSIYKQIQNYDSINGTIEFANTILLDSNKYLPIYYPYFKSSFWMDSEGKQIQEFNTRQLKKKFVKLDHRNYFRNKDAWLLPSAKRGKDTLRFMLESIYSVTTGEALAAISKRSVGPKSFMTDEIKGTVENFYPSAIAISTPMYSIMEPVLPYGFSYSIIDDVGNILFHSNKKRNLQENFLRECNKNKNLQSAIYSKTDEIIHLKYQNRKSIIYIKPIKNIPLFIVTSQDMELINSYNSQVIASSFFYTVGIFIFIGFQILLLMITGFKQSKLKAKEFALEWLLPKNPEVENYFGLSIINLITMLVIITFCLLLSGMEFNLVDSFFLILYSQIILMQFTRQELNFNDKAIIVDTFVVILSLLLIVLNVIHARISFDYYFYLIYQVGIIILLLAFKKLNIVKRIKKILGKSYFEKNFSKIYLVFLMSWLLLLGIFPPVIFFNNASQYERTNAIRYQQLHIARDLEKRNQAIDKYYNENHINDTRDNFYKNLRKEKGIYTNFYFGTNIGKDSVNMCHTEMNEISPLTFLLMEKPLFNQHAVEKRKLVLNTSSDSTWFWQQNKESILYLNIIINGVQKKDSITSDQLYLSTILPYVSLNGFGNFSIAFWSLFFALILLAYLLLKLILSRIFPFHSTQEFSNLTFMDLLENSQNPDHSLERVFAINLSGESDGNLKVNIRHEGFKCVDISTDPDFKDWMVNSDRIILLNFDESINDVSLFTKKNDLLGKITRLKNQQVIISSRRNPIQIIDYYNSLKVIEGADINLIDQEISRFTNLVSQFQTIYCSLQVVSPKSNIRSEIQKLLNSELSQDIFLYGLEKSLLNYYQKNKDTISDEDIILQIQDLASGFYTKLWKSCTLEEKIILYDLARNSLINIKNPEVIRILKILMDKRLVIKADYFRIMNRSFNNYILACTDPKDLQEMDRLSKQNDSWQSFRIPLIIFASGIIIFLIATQQSFLSNLSTMLASFGLIAGIFVKVSGIFSFKGSSSKDS